jgi:Holliday junction resolvase RusA-like endonuclease
VNLFVPGNPIPQGSKRALLRKGTNIPVVIDANRIGLAQWRSQIAAYAMTDKQQSGLATFTGPVAVRLEFYLRRPESHYLPINSKRDVPVLREDAPTYCAATPDLDKLVRSVFDALTDADVWTDDAQAVKVVATKLYADTYGVNGQRSGVLIVVRSWGNGS